MIELETWSADDCATYFRIGKDHFLTCFAKVPNFPRPFTLPINNRGVPGRSQIRWDAAEVREWARKNRQEAA